MVSTLYPYVFYNSLHLRCIFCPEKYEYFFKVFSFGLLLCTFVFVENSGNMKNQTPFFEKLFWSTFGLN